jgi:hypothetical protein
MSDTATAPADTSAEVVVSTTTPPPADPVVGTTDTAAALLAELERHKTETEKYKALMRKQEERARSNADAVKERDALKAELDQFRQSTMSEQEKLLTKAVKEAEAKGRGDALTAVGQRLVRAEFRAAAAGAIPDLDGVLDDLNLAKFVGADGEPDAKQIEAAVRRLTPPKPPEPDPAPLVSPPGPRPDLTQGTRQSMPLNGDPVLDAVKAKLGIR